jgi:MSHA pilin protein MshD
MKNDIIFIIGSLLILSIFSLTLNRGLVQESRTTYEGQAILEAMKLAQRYIESAEMKRFDEKADATIPSSFTAAALLGPDNSETLSTYDDVDDFNGYTITDNSTYSVPFTVSISVQYATVSNSVATTNSTSYYKLMSVSIISQAFKTLPAQTMVIKKVFAYHYFLQE